MGGVWGPGRALRNWEMVLPVPSCCRWDCSVPSQTPFPPPIPCCPPLAAKVTGRPLPQGPCSSLDFQGADTATSSHLPFSQLQPRSGGHLAWPWPPTQCPRHSRAARVGLALCPGPLPSVGPHSTSLCSYTLPNLPGPWTLLPVPTQSFTPSSRLHLPQRQTVLRGQPPGPRLCSLMVRLPAAPPELACFAPPMM